MVEKGRPGAAIFFSNNGHGKTNLGPFARRRLSQRCPPEEVSISSMSTCGQTLCEFGFSQGTGGRSGTLKELALSVASDAMPFPCISATIAAISGAIVEIASDRALR